MWIVVALELVKYFLNLINSRGTFIPSDVQMVHIQIFFNQYKYIKNTLLYYIVLLDTKYYYKLTGIRSSMLSSLSLAGVEGLEFQ